MAINKEHKEFHAVDMDAEGWHTPEGYPAGIEQKILAGSLDESTKIGHRTRLLRFQPGVFTSTPFVHEYWEEVYLVTGDLTVGNDEKGEGGRHLRSIPMLVARQVCVMDHSNQIWGAYFLSRIILTNANLYAEPRRTCARARSFFGSSHPKRMNLTGLE